MSNIVDLKSKLKVKTVKIGTQPSINHPFPFGLYEVDADDHGDVISYREVFSFNMDQLDTLASALAAAKRRYERMLNEE